MTRAAPADWYRDAPAPFDEAVWFERTGVFAELKGRAVRICGPLMVEPVAPDGNRPDVWRLEITLWDVAGRRRRLELPRSVLESDRGLLEALLAAGLFITNEAAGRRVLVRCLQDWGTSWSRAGRRQADVAAEPAS